MSKTRFLRRTAPLLALSTATTLVALTGSPAGAITGSDIIRTVAGEDRIQTQATDTRLYYTTAVAVAANGDIYLADRYANTISQIDHTTGAMTVVIGNGQQGTPTPGPALSSPLSRVDDMAFDSAGTLYLALQYENQIYSVDSGGTLAVVAGDGTPGFSGDSGAATAAQLNGPTGVAVDGTGIIYVADSGNNRVRTIDLVGDITTFAGDGTTGGWTSDGPATGVSLVAPADVSINGTDLLVTDNHHVFSIATGTGTLTLLAGTTAGFSGDSAAATSAQLDHPGGVEADSNGDIYVADLDNQRIRFIDGGTGDISTVAGDGVQAFGGDGGAATSAQLASPIRLAVDANDNVLVADYGNQRIRHLDTTSGDITTVAGSTNYSGDSAAGTSARFGFINDVAVDASGNRYLADTQNDRIRVVDAETGDVTTMAGDGTTGYSGDSGQATSAQLNMPEGLTIDGTDLYIADTGNNVIRKVDLTSGVITTVAGDGTTGYSGDSGQATSARLATPIGLVVFDTDLYIAEVDNSVIRKVSLTSGVITTVAGDGTPGYSGDSGPAASAQLNEPHDVTADGDGNLFVADSTNQRIRRIDAGTGDITTVGGDGTFGSNGDDGPATSAQLMTPYGIQSDPDGNVLVTEVLGNKVRMIDTTSGDITTVVGSGLQGWGGDDGAATSAELTWPMGMAIDDEGRLLLADSLNSKARLVAPEAGAARPADDQVTRLYQAALGRTPDTDGLNYWSDLYRGGRSLHQLAGDLMASSEFTNLYGVSPTNTEFVEALYQNALGRASDDDGRTYWVGQLTAGATRAALLVQFSESDENVTRTGTSAPLDSSQSQVLRMYAAAFGRNPESDGLSYWTNLRRQGMSLAALANEFRASSEYQARYGSAVSNGDFVEALYQNILERAADTDGQTYWLGRLSAGVTRDEVMVSFSESRENLDHTNTAP